MSFLTLKEIKKSLESIPEIKNKVAHYSFRRSKSTPYCVYYRASTSDIGADNCPANLKEQEIIIELYTSKIDEELEQKVEKLFIGLDLEKSETWIEETDEYLIKYSFTQFIK